VRTVYAKAEATNDKQKARTERMLFQYGSYQGNGQEWKGFLRVKERGGLEA
jgi:hypothetical protein